MTWSRDFWTCLPGAGGKGDLKPGEKFHTGLSVSGKLIHKEQLFHLERVLKKQLFGRTEVELKILERYELSGQYTPEKLLELYKDSILYELKHYSILEYNLFRGAKIPSGGACHADGASEDHAGRGCG